MAIGQGSRKVPWDANRTPSNKHPAWGLPQLRKVLRQGGDRINHKRNARFYETRRLSLRRRRRRLPDRPRQVLVQPNQYRSLDLMSDALAKGRAFRTPNVIDDFARDALAISVDFSLAIGRVTREIDELCELY